MNGLFPPFHTGSRLNRHSVMEFGRINPDRLVLSWRARDGACPRPQPWRRTACKFGPKKAVRWAVTRKIRRVAGGGEFFSLLWSSFELHRRALSLVGKNYTLASFCPSGCQTSVWWMCVRPNRIFYEKLSIQKA